MTELFLNIVNRSISAGWLILAVLVLRLLLKKAPRWVHVLLWGIVAVRLLCPFSMESALSLVPSAETIPPEIMMDPAPTIHTGFPAINSAVNPVIQQSFAPEPVASANPLQIWIPICACIWVTGAALLLAYAAISYGRLRRKVRTAVLLGDNLFQSEAVSSPFVLGVIKPKIYLPSHMDSRTLEPVIAHEQAHIRRKDHWWKLLGFLLLAIHWFNPLLWLAYGLLCRDIELACDETVIRELDHQQRADYSQALLACSIRHRSITACPLAFGEVGVKERVKSVLTYRKPAFWVILLAVLVCLITAVCFLTNPRPNSIADMEVHSEILQNVKTLEVASSGLQYELSFFDDILEQLAKVVVTNRPLSQSRAEDRDRTNEIILDGRTVLCFSRDCTELWIDDGVKPSLTYGVLNPEVVQAIFHEFFSHSGQEDAISKGSKVSQWVDYSDSYPDAGTLETERPEFPGVTFQYTPGQVTAIHGSNTTVLISGMPIWNVYFSDLTGDGKPEVCATVSFGSGLIDTHVVVFDYANGQEYLLWDRGVSDYALHLENGRLICDKWGYPDGDITESGELILVDTSGGESWYGLAIAPGSK